MYRGAALAGQISNQDEIEKKYLSLANKITTCWRPIGGFKKTPSLPQLDGSANSEALDIELRLYGQISTLHLFSGLIPAIGVEK